MNQVQTLRCTTLIESHDLCRIPLAEIDKIVKKNLSQMIANNLIESGVIEINERLMNDQYRMGKLFEAQITVVKTSEYEKLKRFEALYHENQMKLNEIKKIV